METSRHYLKSVTDLGDNHKVLAARDILTRGGTKLLARGYRIDSRIYDRLMRQQLMNDLNSCIEVENPLSAQDIARDAQHILQQSALLSAMKQNLKDPDKIRTIIESMPLRPELAFTMMVAREQRTNIYHHSLRVLLMAMYLGGRLDLAERDLQELAVAAVFHDMGELYIDPAIFSQKKPLDESEWRQIYAHPVTAYLFLKEFPEYHPNVSRAVLEHHERLDGSGYPHGLGGDKISLAGKILAIAEVAEGLFDDKRLEIVLKLNKNKLDTDLIGHITRLLPEEFDANMGKRHLINLHLQLDNLARILAQWDGIYAECIKTSPENSLPPLLKFVNDRLSGLRHSLYDAGFNPVEMNHLLSGIDDDSAAILDIDTLLKESSWQIEALNKETMRLWPDFLISPRSDCATVRNWIAQCRTLFALN